MKVVIDGIEYIPATELDAGSLLARALVSEYWGSGTTDEHVSKMSDGLFVIVTDDPSGFSPVDHAFNAALARMLKFMQSPEPK